MIEAEQPTKILKPRRLVATKPAACHCHTHHTRSTKGKRRWGTRERKGRGGKVKINERKGGAKKGQGKEQEMASREGHVERWRELKGKGRKGK